MMQTNHHITLKTLKTKTKKSTIINHIKMKSPEEGIESYYFNITIIIKYE